MKKLIIALGLLLAVAIPAVAQDSGNFGQGYIPFATYESTKIDSIGLFNTGSIQLHIPIVSYPQRGHLAPLSLMLSYSNINWYVVNETDWYNDGYNWIETFTNYWAFTGGGVDIARADTTIGLEDDTCIYGTDTTDCFSAVDNTSGVHPLAATGPTTYETIDATGIRFDATTGTFTDSSGIKHTGVSISYLYQGQWQYGGYDVVQDQDGNAITSNPGYTAPPSIVSWTDSVGRVIPTPPPMIYQYIGPGQYAAEHSPGCVTEQYPGLNGGTYPVTLCYTQYTISSNFQNPDIFDSSYSVVMLSSATLPNATSYTFTYDTLGELTSVTLPTGGTISYTWQNVFCGSCRYLTARSINANDGTGTKTWSYAHTAAVIGGNTYQQTIVTDPDANDTVHTFGEGVPAQYETTTQNYQGPYTGSGLIKTVHKQYSHGAGYPLDYGCDSCSLLYNLVPLQTTVAWANGQTSQTTYSYDNTSAVFYAGPYGQDPTTHPLMYGSLIEQDDYDYGTTPGQPGPLLRKMVNAYQWQQSSSYLNANLLSLISSQTAFDSSNNQVSQNSYAYDEPNGSPSCICGNQTSQTRWLNGGTSPTSHVIYNAYGKPVQDIDANGNPKIFTYDGTGAFVSEIQYPTTNGIAHVEYFTHDGNTGLMTSHTDQNGQVTSYQYDSMNRLTQVTYPPGGGVTSYSYSDATPTPSFTFTKQLSPTTSLVQYGYADGFGRPTKSLEASPNCSSGYITTDTTYDNEGRQRTVSNPYCSVTEATYGITTTSYDPLNRVSVVTLQDGAQTTTSYSGNSVTVADPANKQRRSVTDGLGRLTQVFEDPNGLNYETDYTYNARGNLTNVVQSGSRQRNFVYDSLSRVTSAMNPESGTISYTYDANGNVLTKTDARNIITTMTYDQLNRVTQKIYSDGTTSTFFAYDGTGWWGIPQYNVIGRLMEEWTGTSCCGITAEIFSYDAMGRVVLAGSSSNNGYLPLTYTYDYAGELTQLIYPSGRGVTFHHDAAEHLTNVNFSSFNGVAANYNYLTSATYTPSGAPSGLLLGNGLSETTTYNNRLQPNTSEVWSATINPFYHSYNFTDASGHNDGNVVSIADNLQPNRTQSFTYDSLNRVSSAQTQASSGPDCWGEGYGYDAWGNLLSATPTRCASLSLSVGVYTNNRITNPGVTYDASGNMTSDAVHTYTYDAENRLTQVDGGSTATYLYDAEGRRAQKTAAGVSTAYIYSGGDTIAEFVPSTGAWSDYIFANGRKLARADTYDSRILIQGTVPAGASSQYEGYNFSGPNAYAGYVIQTGDQLFIRQFQTPTACGGPDIGFTDGSRMAFVATDSDGNISNMDSVHNQWHFRQFNLNAFAGRTIAEPLLLAEGCTQPGNWQIYYSDFVLVSADGTVRPIYTRDSSVSLFMWGSDQMVNPSYQVNFAASLDDTLNANENTTYYHGDHLGSSRLLTSGGGWPVWQGTYLPFGQEWNPQSTVNHYKFTGKERDAETATSSAYSDGLDNFGARYYPSKFGRWLSPDKPFADQHASNPQSWNLYEYAGNNPLRNFDPDGFKVIEAIYNQAMSKMNAMGGQGTFYLDFAGIQGLHHAQSPDGVASSFDSWHQPGNHTSQNSEGLPNNGIISGFFRAFFGLANKDQVDTAKAIIADAPAGVDIAADSHSNGVNALGAVAQGMQAGDLASATIVAPNSGIDPVLAINQADGGNTVVFVSSDDPALALALFGSQTAINWEFAFPGIVFDPGQHSHSLNSYHDTVYSNATFQNQLQTLCALGNQAACDH